MRRGRHLVGTSAVVLWAWAGPASHGGDAPSGLTGCLPLVQAHRDVEARTCLTNLLASRPGDLGARKTLAVVEWRLGHEERAADLFEAALASDPADDLLRNNYAWLLATAKNPRICRPARAAALARDALLARPDDYHVWSTLAEAYYASGDYEHAVKAADTALRLGAEQQASPSDLATYQEQAARIRRVAQAFSLVE